MSSPANQARVPLTLAVLLVLGAGLAAAASGDRALVRDRGFAVQEPVDGAEVGGQFRLRWARTDHAAGYAVVVDAVVPKAGAKVAAAAHVLILTDTSLRLAVGRTRSGSPSARGFHTVSVVPLDGSGRRLGEDVAVVHVRNRS